MGLIAHKLPAVSLLVLWASCIGVMANAERQNVSPACGERRVAVCFIGLTRSLRLYTHQSIQDYLLRPLEQQVN